MKARGTFSICAMLIFACGATAQTADVSYQPVSVSDAQLAKEKCVIGLEKYLPGDYYYCLASQSYGRHEYAYAVRFFRDAASWGSKPAAFVLGVMALNGDNQPMNRPLAFAWLTLAAERHTERFQQAYANLKAHLSASELQAADKLLAGMDAYRDAFTMPRAEKRYARGMADLHSRSMASNICMDGTFDFADLAGGSADGEGGANPGTASIMGGACPQPKQLEEKINAAAANVFEDWRGHVSVGPLQQASAPSSKH